MLYDGFVDGMFTNEKGENEMRMTRDFYRPSASVNASMHVIDDVPGSEVYRYSNSNDQPVAIVFGGKRAKPDFYFRFPSVERREEKINEWIENQKSRAADAKVRRAEKNVGHSLKVGDVLSSSWGYDQTNVDFYQVVEVPSKCFVIVREISGYSVSDNGPSVRVKPSKDAFKSEPKRYKSSKSNTISVASYASAYQTDWNESHHETGYGYGH